MKIVVIFDEEKTETVEVKNSKYILYKKLVKFVDKFEKLFNEYKENITPEIVKYSPDDTEKLEKSFYDLKNKINDICFETVDRAYN